MPEAPDLEVIKEFLNDRVQGRTVESATVLRPTVLRSLAGDFVTDNGGAELRRVPSPGQVPAGRVGGRPLAGG